MDRMDSMAEDMDTFIILTTGTMVHNYSMSRQADVHESRRGVHESRRGVHESRRGVHESRRGIHEPRRGVRIAHGRQMAPVGATHPSATAPPPNHQRPM